MAEQAAPTYVAPAEPGTQDFQFANPAAPGADRKYMIYRELEKARIYVAEIYGPTRWQDKVNAWEGSGGDIPAVRTRVGPTIHWWASSDGHFR